MIKRLIAATCFAMVATVALAQTKDTVKLADPTIYRDGDTYYMYGTGAPDGFKVYTSTDLKQWEQQSKNALAEGDSYGTTGFWAPQIFKHKGKYYMAYTANEHIAIAEGDSPLGPFKQSQPNTISTTGRQIDPYIFEDTDGSLYMYHVRLQDGNRIFVAKMKDDMSGIDEATARECIHAEAGWEDTAHAKWPVTEGPTVTKIGKFYYLFYSANDFRNIDYSVGYATATSPMGPWKKYSGNPIISRNNTGKNGSGHGDLFAGKDGKWYYVFHTHATNQATGKRKTAVVQLNVSKSKPAVISIVPDTFQYLELK